MARGSRGLALDGAVTDILSVERSVPADLRHRVVRAPLRCTDGRTDADRAQHASAVGHDFAVYEPRAGVEDLLVVADDALEAGYRHALLVGVGVDAAPAPDPPRRARGAGTLLH